MNIKTACSISLAVFGAFTAYPDSLALRLENDCLVKHSDNDYSNGAALDYWHKNEWRFAVQQNMYTPNDLRKDYHVPGERPYAGWLGITIGKRVFNDENSPWTHYADVKFGMIGPSAKAGETQRFIHKILNCKDPKGWDTQLHDEFCINGEWWTKYNWYLCDYIALVPRAGLIAGTIEDGAEIGCDLKAGWNIRKHKDVGNNMMFSAVKKDNSFLDNFVAYGFIGGDCRYYLYNHFLEGSLFNNKDDDVTVDIEPFVGEFVFGAYIEIYDFFTMYYGTFRTHEYKTQRDAPDYGGLSIGYKWNF